MISKWKEVLVVSALALSTAACETADGPGMVGATGISVGSTNLVMGGENFNDLLKNKTKLVYALENLGSVNVDPTAPNYIHRLIAALRQADTLGQSGLNGLTGINGIYGRTLLASAQKN